MVDRYRFIVPGDPVPKGRPRSARGQKRPYTPKKTRTFEELVRVAAMAAKVQLIEGPVELMVFAEWAWPKSEERKRIPRKWQYHEGGPDIDNVAKAIMDALNGIAYRDDRQVAKLLTTKTRPAQGQPSQTTVYIERLPDPSCLI